MSILQNKDYDKAARVIGKASVICRIAEVRETLGKSENGEPARDLTWISLVTEAPTKTVDGEELPAGFPVDVSLGTYSNVESIVDPSKRDKAVKANEISNRTFRSLVVAALRLPAATKSVSEELTKAGGTDGLKGKRVVADFSASSQGMQNVNKFAAVPEASA